MRGQRDGGKPGCFTSQPERLLSAAVSLARESVPPLKMNSALWHALLGSIAAARPVAAASGYLPVLGVRAHNGIEAGGGLGW